MNHRDAASTTAAGDDDWLERALVADATDTAAGYIDDAGFTASVMATLPPPVPALPAWRKPALTALWAVAGLGLAVALPGTVVDVTREAFRLFAAKPFAVSEVLAVLGLLGVGTWTAAIAVLRRD